MPYIPPEVVEQARQIDLLTYLQSCEPQELVRISGNNYTTRTHDSLKISNGKWMWWSQRIGGYNALLTHLSMQRGSSPSHLTLRRNTVRNSNTPNAL